MSLRELLAGGGGVKSIQTGYLSINNVQGTDGTGEDLFYWDVTVGSVDPAKCLLLFSGGVAQTIALARSQGNTASATYILTGRVTSATNLRFSSLTGGTLADSISLRWQLVEYK